MFKLNVVFLNHIQGIKGEHYMKNFKQHMISYIVKVPLEGTDNYSTTNQDISTQGYREYKIQNGRTLEEKGFTADGMLSYITTYTLSDNAAIRAKLGNYTLYNTQSSSYNSYNTVEVVSDSDSALLLRERTFSNNGLSSQTDFLYEKVRFGSSLGFRYTETNTISITGYGGPGGSVKIPAQINGKPVTHISSMVDTRGLVSRGPDITDVTIPDSVTSIGSGAFVNYLFWNLTSVTFQGTITAENLGSSDGDSFGSPFSGDLRDKYLAGGIGTYTTTAPMFHYDSNGNITSMEPSVWTKQ